MSIAMDAIFELLPLQQIDFRAFFSFPQMPRCHMICQHVILSHILDLRWKEGKEWITSALNGNLVILEVKVLL
jgi:hypothetical protein